MAVNKTTLYSTGLGESVSDGKGGLLVNGSVIYVDTISDLQALPTSGLVDGQEIHISTTGRAGAFVVRVGDFSTEVTNDPQSGVWVKFDDAAATSIAAQRIISGLRPIPEWFGAVGDYDPSGGTGTNDCAAFIACFDYFGECHIGYKHYKYDSGGGAVHRLTKSLVLSGSEPAYYDSSLVNSGIHVINNDPPFYMGGVNSVKFEDFTMFCSKNGPMTDPYASDATLMEGTEFTANSGVHIRGGLDSTQGSDANINTDNLVTSTGAYESAKTITDFDAFKTFDDVATRHGVGLLLSKGLDNKFHGKISGFGVGFANYYNDLMNLDGARIVSNAINVYDKFDTVTSWGRLMKLKNSETLYNLRAPNILLDRSIYGEIDHLYYEVSPTVTGSAVFLASYDANFKMTDAQFDGLVDESIPFMLVDRYSEGNIVKDCYYTQYLAQDLNSPNIRFINTPERTLNKRRGFFLGPQKTSVFPQPDFSDPSNTSVVIDFRDKGFSRSILSPLNFENGKGVSHKASTINNRLAFHEPGATGLFMESILDIPRASGVLNIRIFCQAISGETSGFFQIKLFDPTGKDIATIQNSNISGLSDSSYTVATITYDLDANPIASFADSVFISWPTDGVYVSSVWLE